MKEKCSVFIGEHRYPFSTISKRKRDYCLPLTSAPRDQKGTGDAGDAAPKKRSLAKNGHH